MQYCQITKTILILSFSREAKMTQFGLPRKAENSIKKEYCKNKSVSVVLRDMKEVCSFVQLVYF